MTFNGIHEVIHLWTIIHLDPYMPFVDSICLFVAIQMWSAKRLIRYPESLFWYPPEKNKETKSESIPLNSYHEQHKRDMAIYILYSHFIWVSWYLTSLEIPVTINKLKSVWHRYYALWNRYHLDYVSIIILLSL